ncbi:hypothetical protein DW690_06555 [Dorea longicatena]|nr:hypothetical protein DW690_06555 [Dorea longicatena]
MVTAGTNPGHPPSIHKNKSRHGLGFQPYAIPASVSIIRSIRHILPNQIPGHILNHSIQPVTAA